MTNAQATKLENLRNHATRYELVLQHAATGEKRRLCYTGRKNRQGLVDAIYRNAKELVAFTGSEDFKLSAKGQPLAATLGNWGLSFSGRTQREAIQAGELVWFAAEEAK